MIESYSVRLPAPYPPPPPPFHTVLAYDCKQPQTAV